MADDAELEEFRAWKKQRDKAEVFGLLDEWADEIGLKKFLAEIDGDDGDEDAEETKTLRDAAKKTGEGKKTRAPKKEPEQEPKTEPTSIAARLGLTG